MESEEKKGSHGGARPGAGRKPRPTVQKMVRLTPDEVEAIDQRADALGLTRHAWMLKVIQEALRHKK